MFVSVLRVDFSVSEYTSRKPSPSLMYLSLTAWNISYKIHIYNHTTIYFQVQCSCLCIISDVTGDVANYIIHPPEAWPVTGSIKWGTSLYTNSCTNTVCANQPWCTIELHHERLLLAIYTSPPINLPRPQK